MKPQLYIEQQITAFTNKYQVFAATEAGDKAGLVAFAQQKRIALKERVSFYTSEQKETLSFSFAAEKVLDVHGRYIVEDESGNQIGAFKKEFKQSLLNSTWKIFDANGNELFMIRESNAALALLRRFAGFIPVVGGFVDIVLMFLRYHFEFIDLQTNQQVGKYQKMTLFRDHYQLSMTQEAYDRCDWRVFAAMGVGLDALQSR